MEIRDIELQIETGTERIQTKLGFEIEREKSNRVRDIERLTDVVKNRDTERRQIVLQIETKKKNDRFKNSDRQSGVEKDIERRQTELAIETDTERRQIESGVETDTEIKQIRQKDIDKERRQIESEIETIRDRHTQITDKVRDKERVERAVKIQKDSQIDTHANRQ